jgi:hypothetical protein
MLERNFHDLHATHEFTDERVAECAALSLDVYMHKDRPPLPSGWTLFRYQEYPNDYAAACYVKNDPNPTQVVFAHRGTQINFNNVKDDLEISLGKIPETLKSVYSFLNETYKLFSEKYPGDKSRYTTFAITGHSLGGVLAELCITYNYSILSFFPIITFENPGSKPLIIKYYKDQGVADTYIEFVLSNTLRNCRNYVAGVNLINTCNDQVGRTFRINTPDYEVYTPLEPFGTPSFPPPPAYFLNLLYMGAYTLEQHEMKKILGYLMEGRSVIEVDNPIGFQAGYIEYLNPLNTKYWDNFFKKVWDAAPLIHLKYHDYEEFKIHCYSELTPVYETAKAMKHALTEQGNEILPAFPNESVNQYIPSRQTSEKSFSPQLNLFKEKVNNPRIDDDIINEFTLVEKEVAQEEPRRTTCSVM